MKLYVLPIGARCNAKCPYCITRFRKLKNNVLDLNTLKKLLNKYDFDKIEITGGGEPSLHPNIEQVIEMCDSKCPTNIYTNGNLETINQNIQICISRAHYDNDVNKKIMGVDSDIQKYVGHKDVKLSLMLHKSGISTLSELKRYIDWAKSFANKIVVRQLFEYEDERYQEYYKHEYVSSIDLANKFGQEHSITEIEGNFFTKSDNLEIEFEGRACACENDNPVLASDGQLRRGWGDV